MKDIRAEAARASRLIVIGGYALRQRAWSPPRELHRISVPALVRP
ncbi:hypothetical protein [Nonomuraea sp. NPDC049750]